MTIQKKTTPLPTTKLLAKGSLFRVMALLISTAAAFITLPLVLNLLGTHWYGIWVVVGTFMGYFGVLDFGLSSATTRFLSLHWNDKDKSKVSQVISTSTFCFLCLSVISLILSSIGIWVVPQFLDNPLEAPIIQLILLIMAIDMATTFPFATFQSVLGVKLRHDILSSIETIQIIIRTALIYWIATHNGSIVDLAIITLIVNIATRIVKFSYAYKYLPNGSLAIKHINFKEIKTYLHFGKFSFLGQIGDILRFRIDTLVIAAMIGASHVAFYNIALQLSQIISNLVKVTIGGAAPLFTQYYAEKRFDQMQEKLLLMTKIGITMSAMASCSALLVAEPFIKIWVGEEMLSSFSPFIVLAVLIPLGIGQGSLIHVLYATAQHHYYAYVNMAEAVINVALSLLLIQEYGITGVALGTAIPFVISKFIAVPYYACRSIHMPISTYRVHFLKTLLSILILEAPLFLIVQFYNLTNFWEIFVLTSFGQILIGFITLKYLLSHDEYNYVYKAVPPINQLIRRRA
ncbi:MAG: hypothetical protein COB26_02880 [Piscirickettsiaceae bacterium]|nr:MAG: hypothetical protein COB26_02880 [Piscirickettsiaceae bacterium]